MTPVATTDTRTRLVEAALAVLSEHGYRGATTRAIAERAGLSEVTLFRHFTTKANLVAAAVDHATAPFRASGRQFSGDLVHDLIALATDYAAFIDRWPALADRVLPEISTDPELGAHAAVVLAANADAVRSLIEHHQAAARLTDVPTADVIRAFLGPLLARATLRAVLPTGPFDAATYVRRFLDGHLA